MAAQYKAIFGPDGIRNLTCHLKMENVYSADDTRQWLYEIWGTARDMRLQEASNDIDMLYDQFIEEM